MLPAVFTALCVGALFERPVFCRGLDCPVFESRPSITVGEVTLEVRQYVQGQLWVSTTVQKPNIEEAEHEGFLRLFHYIQGENVEGTKIDMTSPVRNDVRFPKVHRHNANVTVSFYVPYVYQPALVDGAVPPPRPTNPTVFVQEQMEPVTYAVYTFPGFTSTDSDMRKRISEMETVLTQAGVKHDKTSVHFQAYDPPFRLDARHNELWMKLREA